MVENLNMRSQFHLLCAIPLTVMSFGCASKPNKSVATGTAAQDVTATKVAPARAVDVSLLLGMSYQEAATLTAAKLDLAQGIRLAADKIEVLKSNEQGPTKVRATGHVFVQVSDELPYTAMSHEALINGSDVILRGRPATQRGVSLIEGLSDSTVFYMVGPRLRVIGRHKVGEVGRVGPGTAPEVARSLAANFGHLPLPFSDAGPWKGGANPLLPPLNEDVVPAAMRNELHKAAEAEAVLQQSREGVAPAFPEAKVEVVSEEKKS